MSDVSRMFNVSVNEDTNLVTVDEDKPNHIIVKAGSVSSVLTQRHTHVQGSAATTWVITHALAGKPSVTIVDSADTHVFGEVTYNSNSQITVTFSAAFSGKAYLT